MVERHLPHFDPPDTSSERRASGADAASRHTNGDGEGLGLDADGIAALRASIAAWRSGPVREAEARVPPRASKFTTWSGIEVPDLATPVDKRVRYPEELGLPGEYPFTRGVQPTMYRGRLWTMRMFAGFGTP